MTMTIPGVCAFTVHGFYTNGRPIANTFDFQIDTTGSALSREEVIEDQAEALRAAWQEHILTHQCNNYSLTGVSWVDLDEVDGSTGSIGAPTSGATTGSRADPAATPQVAYLVRKVINGVRGSKGGRFYVVGVDEAMVTEDGVVNTAFAASFQTALDDFLSDVNLEEGVTSITNMAVRDLPPRPAPPLPDNRVGDFHLVNSLVLDPVVATQRRRLQRS